MLLYLVTDVTDIALEWAEKNVKSNPHISNLIEIRKADIHKKDSSANESRDLEAKNEEKETHISGTVSEEVGLVSLSSSDSLVATNKTYTGPPILLGVVRENETFDFCMCNPPFFENPEEAGLNPKTACGGTPEEMVCEGGEKAFVTHLIEDSVVLKQTFRSGIHFQCQFFRICVGYPSTFNFYKFL